MTMPTTTIARLLVGAGLLSLVGCGGDVPVRRYQEVRIHPVPALAPVGDAHAGHAHAAALSWQGPEGWDEQPGSGMRLATFVVEGGKAQCTITSFPGDVGGLEANLRRWLGQLDLVLDDESFSHFAGSGQPFETDSHLEGRIFDFTTLASEPDDPSMIATILQRGNAQVFVKLTGPGLLITGEREPFESLCRSIK